MEIISNENNIRLDKFLASTTDFNRAKIQKLIKLELVTVNGKHSKNNYSVKEHDVIEIKNIQKESSNLEKYNIDLNIVFEDEHLIVVNKPSNLVVHPANGHQNDTLVNALINYNNCFSSFESDRPGIVHRIDKDTSGLLIVAKNEKTVTLLSEMIKEKKVTRKYLALVHGVIKHSTGTIDAPIGRNIANRKAYEVTSVNSKNAVTHFKVLENYDDATLIECKLETGRTHQIRVHMKYINHPIVNDSVYGRKKIIDNYGQMLHAYKLSFIHPITNEQLNLTAKPEKRFTEILDSFRDLKDK
ncbi:MAG: RluA family pseudouridine synthase [Bacilli bacterium]